MSGPHFSQHKLLPVNNSSIYTSRSESPLVGESSAWIERWPTSPATIKRPQFSIWLELFVDLTLFIFSIAFFAFGAVVRYYDQKPTEYHPRTTGALVEAAKYGPSVFPILFACVVGRATHAILLWRLERGERIGVLDMLAGSTSLTRTLASQFQLRIMSFLGPVLILIWILSPIGGQASFRQMSIGTSTESQAKTFVHMTFGGNVNPYQGSASASYIANVGSLLAASLLAPSHTKLGPVDIWNNVKIPMIEVYENHTTPGEGGWFDVNQSKSVYSSLVGIPIAGINGSLEYSVPAMETQYLRLECPVVNETYDGHSIPIPGMTAVGTGCAIWSGDNDTVRYNAGQSVRQAREFTYFDHGPTRKSVCRITTTYVEVNITCDSTKACAVSGIRRSRRAHPSPAYTLLDLQPQGWDIFSYYFAKALGGHELYPTTIQLYLVTPENPLSTALQWVGDYEPGLALTKEDYEIRLGQLINSQWTIMNALYAVTAGMNPGTAWMEGTSSDMSIFADPLANSSITPGTTSQAIPVIECHMTWFVLLSIASLVLVAASLIHPIFRLFLTSGPDLMLNLSSLITRNNAYVPVPSRGTFMSPSKRAKLLKNVRLRFGDVNPFAETGTLAIGMLESSQSSTVTHVQEKRKYK